MAMVQGGVHVESRRKDLMQEGEGALRMGGAGLSRRLRTRTLGSRRK